MAVPAIEGVTCASCMSPSPFELGIASQVTSFTASDVGRVLTANDDGSDHGWGSMHFVLGGAISGKRFYGSNPVLANGGREDMGQGRLVPTMVVDQYAATLASWFGMAAANLPAVVPNIGAITRAARPEGTSALFR